MGRKTRAAKTAGARQRRVSRRGVVFVALIAAWILGSAEPTT